MALMINFSYLVVFALPLVMFNAIAEKISCDGDECDTRDDNNAMLQVKAGKGGKGSTADAPTTIVDAPGSDQCGLCTANEWAPGLPCCVIDGVPYQTDATVDKTYCGQMGGTWCDDGTSVPTQAPTSTPTSAPSVTPTSTPTSAPTVAPTDTPTTAPTDMPTTAPTVAPEPTPSSLCEEHKFSWSGFTWTGLGCTFESIAKAWVEAGGSKDDCTQTMAIALGEGVNPDCKTNLEDCVQSTKGFPLDIPSYDQQCTLGPWQVLSTTDFAASPLTRAQEAIEYMQNNCGTPSGAAPNCKSFQCQKTGPDQPKFPNCHNSDMVDGGCLCAFCAATIDAECDAGWSTPRPSTIFATSKGQFCGCVADAKYATTGWSGRCTHHNTKDYQNHLPMAQKLCAKIDWSK